MRSSAAGRRAPEPPRRGAPHRHRRRRYRPCRRRYLRRRSPRPSDDPVPRLRRPAHAHHRRHQLRLRTPAPAPSRAHPPCLPRNGATPPSRWPSPARARGSRSASSCAPSGTGTPGPARSPFRRARRARRPPMRRRWRNARPSRRSGFASPAASASARFPSSPSTGSGRAARSLPFVYHLGPDFTRGGATGWRATLNHEVSEAFWVPLGHLFDPRAATRIEWPRPGRPETLHAGIEFEGRVIWGLTLRVLATFADLVGKRLAALDS